MRRSVISSVSLSLLLAACGDDDGATALEPLPETPAYAVVLSDYTSTAIAMLRADGTAIDEQWISSGTALPGLVAALSGDVDLPTDPTSDGALWLIDRFQTDVLTRIAIPEGTILGQVRTQETELLATGWASNPQDLVVVDEDLAWVSRYETNIDPEAPELERGNDLYAIDPSTMTRLGQRIDLSMYDEPLEGGAVAQARPGSIVRLGDVLIVGLARLTGAFDGAGQGAVVEVTLSTGATRLIELEGLRSCSRVVPVSETRALVGCTGFGMPFGDPVSTRATSGIATIDVSGGAASVTRVLRFGEHEDLPIAGAGVVALDADRALGIAWGSFMPASPDRLYEIDLAGETATEIASGGAFELGGMAWDPEASLLLVPDATAGIRRFTRSGAGQYSEMDAIQLAPELGLPPRGVHAL